MKNILVTFGCSWTYGVGAHYKIGMTDEGYKVNAWNTAIIEQYAFRTLISDKINFKNINFSRGGSSNQRQFRLAKKFFLSKDEQWFHENNVIVLWGLTSLYRNEFFDANKNEYYNFFLGDEGFAQIIFEKYFSESVELQKLSEEMKMFDYFFAQKNIKNYWYNTFNEHTYTFKFDNLLFNGRDLLSILVNDYDKNDKYHISNWYDTDRKITQAKEQGLVNPFSLHPTAHCHKIIADYFLKEIEF
jgi:hypothetical protein